MDGQEPDYHVHSPLDIDEMHSSCVFYKSGCEKSRTAGSDAIGGRYGEINSDIPKQGGVMT